MSDLAARHTGPLPNVFYVLAAQARARDPERPASAHVPTACGGWFALDASPLDDERYGPVAVVIRPARREGLLDTRLRAFGLSRREREVAELAVQGRSVKEIALELVLSRHTVSDHLKHVYEKTSVRSRGELSLLAASRPPTTHPD
jgi:DNA-binding CsgD family transcriptional regulator